MMQAKGWWKRWMAAGALLAAPALAWAQSAYPHRWQLNMGRGVTASSQNQFLIVEVLEEDAPCPALEEVLAEYRRPVVVTDEVLGELTLDKDLDMFEGEVPWRG